MAVVRVQAGACGFTTIIKAELGDGHSAVLDIESDCEAVRALADELGELGMRDVLTKGWGQGPVFQAAADTLAHNACPVVAGIFKAAEVAMGLNLPNPAFIEFVEQD